MMQNGEKERIPKKIVGKIKPRTAQLVILGSGYIGLTTAALFVDAGFDVTAVDTNSKIVKSVNSGVSPINEPGLQELISRNVQKGKLKAALNVKSVSRYRQ